MPSKRMIGRFSSPARRATLAVRCPTVTLVLTLNRAARASVT